MDQVDGWVDYVRDLSGGHEDPEFDLNYWTCNKYPSELNMSDFTKIRDKYRISERGRLIFYAKTDQPCNPHAGHVAMMSDAFKCGMRLSLHPFFRALLRSYNVCPYQMSPNFWNQAVGTWLIWQEEMNQMNKINSFSPFHPTFSSIWYQSIKLKSAAIPLV
ncbi:Uncharacterized protein Fot_38513 [Forsythia ovata]|uniref:Transposase (putative) gypsy type domain-containing protein n=1 Tax=Forsythia ovata TaxID=205694 RepID=A0ABD1S221_9LAMI